MSYNSSIVDNETLTCGAYQDTTLVSEDKYKARHWKKDGLELDHDGANSNESFTATGVCHVTNLENSLFAVIECEKLLPFPWWWFLILLLILLILICCCICCCCCVPVVDDSSSEEEEPEEDMEEAKPFAGAGPWAMDEEEEEEELSSVDRDAT
mmetsp:Transcript_9232/g.8652  ORF Transcript_9232/g.8652 Transcript_9232/m.8652 type:complete len:154 (-) Transcript_9232:297-758(-)